MCWIRCSYIHYCHYCCCHFRPHSDKFATEHLAFVLLRFLPSSPLRCCTCLFTSKNPRYPLKYSCWLLCCGFFSVESFFPFLLILFCCLIVLLFFEWRHFLLYGTVIQGFYIFTGNILSVPSKSCARLSVLTKAVREEATSLTGSPCEEVTHSLWKTLKFLLSSSLDWRSWWI